VNLALDVCIQRFCAYASPVAPCAGLTPAMYMRGHEEVPNPDAQSGLYIRNRQGRVVKAVIPPDHIAFQV